MAEPVKDDRSDALADLEPEILAAYEKVSARLTELEGKLPKVCTPENQEQIGAIIKAAKLTETFANDAFKTIAAPSHAKINRQRGLWKPLWEKADSICKRATFLVDGLLAEQRKKREQEEAKARETAKLAAQQQAEAEAQALNATTDAEAAAAKTKADAAWEATKKAVQALDKGPQQTAVKVGGVTVFEAGTLDYEIVDMGKFATAHPDLVEVRRGPTLAGLRDAVRDLPEVPESVAGWPGVRVFVKKDTRSR